MRRMTPERALRLLIEGKDPFAPQASVLYAPLYRQRRVYRWRRKGKSGRPTGTRRTRRTRGTT